MAKDDLLKERYGRISEILDVSALHQKRITIVGLGSIGSVVTDLLVRHGVGIESPGRICLIDGDVVEARNLTSCLSYRPEHIGMFKVEAMAQIIKELVDGN